MPTSENSVSPTLGETLIGPVQTARETPKGNAPTAAGHYAEGKPPLAARGMGHRTVAQGIVRKQPHVASPKRRPRRM
jgi:hypothetical protein